MLTFVFVEKDKNGSWYYCKNRDMYILMPELQSMTIKEFEDHCRQNT